MHSIARNCVCCFIIIGTGLCLWPLPQVQADKVAITPKPVAAKVYAIQSSKNTLDLKELKRGASQFIDKTKGRVVVDNLRILAWSAKVVNYQEVPPTEYEEAIVLVQWRPSGTYSLKYLIRIPSDIRSHMRVWRDPEDFAYALPCEKHFEVIPTEDQIVSFVQSTNFGNNDIDTLESELSTIVLCVFCYDAKMSILLKVLEDGISHREKQRRWMHWMNQPDFKVPKKGNSGKGVSVPPTFQLPTGSLRSSQASPDSLSIGGPKAREDGTAGRD